jgi:hypothetical protein
VTTECRVCLIEHNAEVHAATLRIHSSLRARLARVLGPVPEIEPTSQPPFRPPLGSIKSLVSPAARKKRERCPNQK